MAQVKHGRVWIGVGLVLLVGAFVVASLKQSQGRGAREVRMEKVRRDRLESWVRAPGLVRPERLVQVSSNVIGRVQGLNVVEGQHVRRGDLLLKLDNERYGSALAGTQAQVDAAAADVKAAEAQDERSRQQLLRQERLFADSLLSADGLEQVRAQAKADDARLRSARETLREQEAFMAESRKDLKETVFYAPMDGIITALNVEEGENVVTGTMNNPGTVILTLADLDTMEVEADVDESDVVRVVPGQTARVKVDAWEDSVLAGTVTTVGMSGRKGSETTQQQGTNFKVKVRILTPPPGLRPGMSADVELLSGQKDSALVVPIQALVAQPERIVQRWMSAREDRAHGRRHRPQTDADAEADTGRISGTEKMVEGIFLERKGHASFTPVHTGLRGDTEVEISGEVRPGDTVITGPYRVLRTLTDDTAVKPEKKGKRPEKGSESGSKGA